MDNAQKTALKSGSIFGLVGAAAIAPVATPVIWAALVYGTYRFAKAIYRNAKLNELPPGGYEEDNLFF